MISKQETLELLEKARVEWCIESRNKAVMGNLGIAHNVARKVALKDEYEDVLHSAVEGLIIACDKFDPEKGEFGTFAYYYAMSKAWTFKFGNTQVKLPRSTQVKQMHGEEDKVDVVSYSNEEFVDGDEFINAIDIFGAIDKLQDKQKEAVLKVFVEGKTFKEAGDELGISHQAVASRIDNALKSLKKAGLND